MPKIAPTSPLYAQFRQDFPAQAGEGITGDLNYSDTIVPIVDMTSAAGEGVLPQNLQTAWDFSTGFNAVVNSATTIINNTGFWQIDLTYLTVDVFAAGDAKIEISDGTTTKTVWQFVGPVFSGNAFEATTEDKFVVFLRSGDSVIATSPHTYTQINVWYRQIADINGNVVNPQGFTFN